MGPDLTGDLLGETTSFADQRMSNNFRPSLQQLETLRTHLRYILVSNQDATTAGLEAYDSGRRICQNLIPGLAQSLEAALDSAWQRDPGRALAAVNAALDYMSGYAANPQSLSGVGFFGDATKLCIAVLTMLDCRQDEEGKSILRETVADIPEGGRAFVAYVVWSELFEEQEAAAVSA